MTNITAEQRLALARAVYGEAAHTGPHYDLRMDGTSTYFDSVVRVATDNGIDLFTPESNPAQLLDVLCWLLRHRQTPDTEMQVRDDCVASCAFDDEGDAWRVWWIEHNCTPAGLSDAIVRAAVRVMEGE